MSSYNNYNNNSTEEDDLVIADMSGVERPPILNPFPGAMRRERSGSTGSGKSGGRHYGPEGVMPGENTNRDAATRHAAGSSYETGPELDAEGRRALIGGAVSAGLLVAGVIAAAFAILILVITHIWG